MTRQQTGNVIIAMWILALLIGILCLSSCTKHTEAPECDKKCQDFKDSIKREFDKKKIMN